MQSPHHAITLKTRNCVVKRQRIFTIACMKRAQELKTRIINTYSITIQSEAYAYEQYYSICYYRLNSTVHSLFLWSIQRPIESQSILFVRYR
jgi:hypothetical protein